MSDETTMNIAPTVDFLTVTTKEGIAGAALIMCLIEAVGIDFITKERSRPWHFCGFHGTAYDGLRYGVRDEETIVMLSGPKAARLWQHAAPRRSHCSRIDLAVTVTLPEPDYSVAKEAYLSALRYPPSHSALINNSRGGSTTYIGSRKSRLFGRLYDKGAEQAEAPGYIWRYEVELKKPASELAVASLLSQASPGDWILGYVHDFYTARGVNPLFSAEPGDYAIEIGAEVTSSDRSLEWLRTQVRPTVGRLLIEGREVEVLGALGLPDYVKPHLSLE